MAHKYEFRCTSHVYRSIMMGGVTDSDEHSHCTAPYGWPRGCARLYEAPLPPSFSHSHNVRYLFNSLMPPVQSTTTTQPDFEALLDAALSKYKKRTGQDLRDHPLAAIIDRSQSLDAILAIFQEQSRAFDEFRNGDPKLIKWLTPVVNGLYAISTSTVISTAASLVSAYPLLRDRYSMINVL
jgi:hypothetical protein